MINELRLGEEFAPMAEGGRGKVPVADYRLATEIPHPRPSGQVLSDVWQEGTAAQDHRGATPVFSFCMCPGGQIVCTSVDPEELCINGMSFSKRHSKWANSALVASVETDDAFLTPFAAEAAAAPGGHPAMGGVLFQREM